MLKLANAYECNLEAMASSIDYILRGRHDNLFVCERDSMRPYHGNGDFPPHSVVRRPKTEKTEHISGYMWDLAVQRDVTVEYTASSSSCMVFPSCTAWPCPIITLNALPW